MTWIRISDPRSHRAWCIKGSDESVTRVNSSVPLIYHDPSDLGSLILIQITPKKCTLHSGTPPYGHPVNTAKFCGLLVIGSRGFHGDLITCIYIFLQKLCINMYPECTVTIDIHVLSIDRSQINQL